MMSWEQVGVVDVDSGMIMIGDPCYHLHKEKRPDVFGKDWDEFVDAVLDNMKREIFELFHDTGLTGLGVVTGTGSGDGSYPVYVRRNEDGRIAQVLVDFMGTFDDSNQAPPQ